LVKKIQKNMSGAIVRFENCKDTDLHHIFTYNQVADFENLQGIGQNPNGGLERKKCHSYLNIATCAFLANDHNNYFLEWYNIWPPTCLNLQSSIDQITKQMGQSYVVFDPYIQDNPSTPFSAFYLPVSS